ncbi:left-right determination factor 2-like [Hyaena hyaena]|uniref:left-right determination factor 2-like n=1 Tax=Hyaena hyaena TaxID=95912 RepID=UPI0019218E1D|nr:left-right determination factor 2-like [Hyaena hyaena]
MGPLWLCWVLWALPLPGPGAALTGEQVLESLLRQLGLSEAPGPAQRDAEEPATPAHVRAQYVALLRRSHGARSRGKRFSQRVREVAGRLLASEASTHVLVFSMEGRLPPDSELVQAVLRLFQQPVPKAALRRLSPHSARVTVQWLLVSLHESGWKPFKGTKAVNFWRQLSRPGQPLLLQVSVQREHLGPWAPSAHKLVRFASQGLEGTPPSQMPLQQPPPRDDCDPGALVAEDARCCCQEMYIDLRGMTWAQHWVLVTPGFLAYECVGACRQPPGPRTFRGRSDSEITSLPVMISVKEGDRPRPWVVSLLDVRVEKCACSWDGAPVPRKLGP